MVVAAADAAASSADASLDMAATPLDVLAPPDSLPDAEAEEAAVRMDAAEAPGAPDAAGFEAAKPADAAPVDIDTLGTRRVEQMAVEVIDPVGPKVPVLGS